MHLLFISVLLTALVPLFQPRAISRTRLILKIKAHFSELPYSTAEKKVIIVDGMAVVQTLRKFKSTLTCKDLKDQFIAKVKKIGTSYKEIRVLMDTYISSSLKEQTRKRRSGYDPIDTEIPLPVVILKPNTFFSGVEKPKKRGAGGII